jgi:hypothetical protein
LSTHRKTQTMSTIRTLALLMAPDSTCAPYEGTAVDGKGNKGVNSGWTARG